MFLLAVAFLAGHCVIHARQTLPGDTEWTALFALGIGCIVVHLFYPRLRRVAAVLLACMVGFGHAGWWAQDRLSNRWPASRSGTDVEMTGFIASIVENRVDSKRFRFDVVDPNLELPKHVELSVYAAEISPAPGERWQFRVRLRSPRGFANPGGFDYEAQLLREGVGATGYVRDASTNRRLEDASGYWVLRMRAAIANRLAQALPDSQMIGVVQGLVIGDTSRMSAEQWRVFSATGTTHLMAISGMHIGMIALAFAWAVGRAARFAPLQRFRLNAFAIEAVAGIVAGAFYSALAGFSVPTQRTLMMLCVYFVTRLFRREVSPTQGLSLALIGVLALDPFAPLLVGFWLSFGAVAALFLAGAGRLSAESKVREFGRMQWTATVALLPLVIVAFGSVSVISPLVNLVAIPFFTLVIVPWVLLSSLFLFISDALGSLLLYGAVRCLEWGWIALEWASRSPIAIWPLPQPTHMQFVMLIAGSILLLAPGVMATRIVGFLMCMPAFLCEPPRPSLAEFDVAVLDVGQGLAVVVTTRTHTLLYDTGPAFRGGRNTGELVVVPYLRSKGVSALDAVMVSHGDSDHAGGLDGVLKDFDPTRLLLGPSVEPRQRGELCMAGQSWRWDEVRFEVLYPPRHALSSRRNDTSCVVRVKGAGGSVILFGDIERSAEDWLLSNKVDLRADIAVVPHHGSRTSSSIGIVTGTGASYALFSAGFGNQWGFPKEDVVSRWQSAGALSLQTAQEGALEFRVSKEGVLQPKRYRKVERRYWRN